MNDNEKQYRNQGDENEGENVNIRETEEHNTN